MPFHYRKMSHKTCCFFFFFFVVVVVIYPGVREDILVCTQSGVRGATRATLIFQHGTRWLSHDVHVCPNISLAAGTPGSAVSRPGKVPYNVH